MPRSDLPPAPSPAPRPGERRSVRVIRRQTGEVLIEAARWCDRIRTRWRGFQFRRSLQPGEALVLVSEADGIASSAIHMLFVFFPIAAIWINGRGRVTWAQLARPWRPYYASPAPARYVIETSPDFLGRISIGDEVDFIASLD